MDCVMCDVLWWHVTVNVAPHPFSRLDSFIDDLRTINQPNSIWQSPNDTETFTKLSNCAIFDAIKCLRCKSHSTIAFSVSTTLSQFETKSPSSSIWLEIYTNFVPRKDKLPHRKKRKTWWKPFHLHRFVRKPANWYDSDYLEPRFARCNWTLFNKCHDNVTGRDAIDDAAKASNRF